MNGARIYLDHAATTPCREEAIAAMVPLMAEPGNAGSSHAEGRRARAAVDDARAKVAELLGARPREIVFTAGGSEADTLAIVGVARALRDKGRHIVTVATEHHAVLHAADTLRDDGWEVTVLGVDADGQIDPDEFAASLRRDTVLASVMLANNEIGVIAPVAQVARIARDRGVLFHTDAVQAASYLSLDLAELGVDLLSISAHKFYGPKGVGALYVRTGTPVAPIIVGGGQEAGLRAGTENVPGVAGLAIALELAVGERDATAKRVAALRDAFEDGVRRRFPEAVVHGGKVPGCPTTPTLASQASTGRHFWSASTSPGSRPPPAAPAMRAPQAKPRYRRSRPQSRPERDPVLAGPRHHTRRSGNGSCLATRNRGAGA